MYLDSAFNIQRGIEMGKLTQLVQEMNAAQKRFRDEGKLAIKEASREFFAANPEVTAIAWTQYAPHFNDGEPCEFNVHDMYATTLSIDNEDFSAEGLSWGDVPENTIADSAAVRSFISELQSIPDDLMESLFGSDSLCLLTPGGITIDDFDHD